MWLSARFVIAAAVLAWAGVALSQQTPPTDAGRILQEVQPRLQAPAPKSAGDLRLAPEVSRPALAAGGSIVVKAFRITGNASIAGADLQALIADAIGKPATLADLRRLAERIAAHYRAAGYPLATAIVPPQEVQDGTVEIRVVEGTLGQVRLNNRAGLADNALAPLLDLRSGEPISTLRIERALMLTTDVPGVEVKSSMQQAATPGAADLVVDIAPNRSVTGSLELDNYGGRYTGRERVGGGLALNNPGGFGDAVSLRALASSRMAYGRIGYQVPLGADAVRVGIAYSDMHYALGEEFSNLRASGGAQVASLNALWPMVRSGSANLYLMGNFDRRKTQDRVDSVATITDKLAQVTTLSLAGDLRDGLGGGGANSIMLSYIGGRLTLDAVNAATDATGLRTAGGYDKLVLAASRLQTIANRWALNVALNAQYAGKNLDTSERMGLGGPTGVRAYPGSEASGDDAVIVGAELRYQPMDALQLGFFYDYGHARTVHRPIAAGRNDKTLRDRGLSLVWNDPSGFTLRGAVAWRYCCENATAEPNTGHRLWLQAIKSF